MTDLIVVEKPAEWQRLKTLVLDSVSSPITRRVYNMALDEFISWYGLEPRFGFSKATVSAWAGKPHPENRRDVREWDEVAASRFRSGLCRLGLHPSP